MRPIPLAAVLAGLALSMLPGAARAQVAMRFQTAAYADAATAPLADPLGVACSGARVLVADSGNGRLLEYELVGEALVARREIRLPELPYPAKLQFSSRGDLFVYDGRLRRVGRVTPAGGFGGFVDPPAAAGAVVVRSFALDRKDQVHLLDAFGGRVLVLGDGGAVAREIAFPRGPGSWSDLSVDVDGTVILPDPVGRQLWSAPPGASVIAPLGKPLLQEAHFPTAVLADGEERLFVTDRTGGGILVASRDGAFRGREGTTGWKTGLLRDPSQVCLAAGPRLVVADTSNNRVQVFALQP